MTGGPGVGKSPFLRGLHAILKPKCPSHGDVIIVAPTGSCAKTANGQTLHSFFGFDRDYNVVRDAPAAEAARLVATPQFVPIRRRLAVVRILLLDEVSMVAADVMDVTIELLIQSRLKTAPLPTFYAFGDFLQLGLLFGTLAFTGRAWTLLFGSSILWLTTMHHQGQPDFVRAIMDARFGWYTEAVKTLILECIVTEERYRELKCNVLHLTPHHDDVQKQKRPVSLRAVQTGAAP